MHRGIGTKEIVMLHLIQLSASNFVATVDGCDGQVCTKFWPCSSSFHIKNIIQAVWYYLKKKKTNKTQIKYNLCKCPRCL